MAATTTANGAEKPASSSWRRRQETIACLSARSSCVIPMTGSCMRRWTSYVLPEPARELLDETGREHVGHPERVLVDPVVGGDVGGPVAVEPGDGLLRRQRQVLGEHGLHLAQLPEARIRLVEQGRDVVGVLLPP